MLVQLVHHVNGGIKITPQADKTLTTQMKSVGGAIIVGSAPELAKTPRKQGRSPSLEQTHCSLRPLTWRLVNH
jgi:hypothetical protein